MVEPAARSKQGTMWGALLALVVIMIIASLGLICMLMCRM
jgi:hypothetical protein